MSTSVDDRLPGATCEVALDGDTPAAYVAGRLGDRETEAFEEHYFACEDCWALVQTASAARASFEADRGHAPALPARRSRRAVLVPAVGLAAAAAGLTLFGVLRTESGQPAGEVFRGVGQTMSLEAVVDETTVRTRWAPVTQAASYELRLYDPSGRLLRASEVNVRTVAVDIDLLELGGVPSVAAVDVVALDAFGQVLLRSQRVMLRP